MTPEELKEYNRNYRKTDAYKESQRKWRESDKAKVWWDKRKSSKAYKDMQKEWRKTSNYKDSKLRSCYGITIEQYNEKLKLQNGCCAICKNSETRIKNGKTMALCVDHNHTTKQVRGLLCSHCNTILGASKENIDTLLQSIEYLKIWRNDAK